MTLYYHAWYARVLISGGLRHGWVGLGRLRQGLVRQGMVKREG